MQLFHIRYRNSQGALMRILNAVSRRGLDLASVHAEHAGRDHLATMLLEVSHKQMGQLFREWYSIVDVIEVASGAALPEHIDHGGWAPHPPASATVAQQSAQAARA